MNSFAPISKKEACAHPNIYKHEQKSKISGSGVFFLLRNRGPSATAQRAGSMLGEVGLAKSGHSQGEQTGALTEQV